MKLKHFLIFLSLIGLYSCSNAPKLTPEQDILYTNMDTTVDPGEDFFLYANGGWIKKNPIPEAYAAWGIGNLIVEDIREKIKTINENALKENAAKGSNSQKLGDFYFSGMDTLNIEKQGVNALEKEIAAINSATDLPSLMKVVASMHRKGCDPFFSGGIYQDAKKSDEMALYISQGGLGLPNRDYYFNTDARTTKIREDYTSTYLKKMLELSGNTPAETESGSKSIYALEKKLAAKSRKLEDLRDPYANYNKMDVGQLNKLCPSINWGTLLNDLGANSVDSVIIGQPEFFAELNTVLKTTPLNELKQYLKLNLIGNYSSYLNKDITDESFRFYGKVISGRKVQLPRWKRVLDAEENAMGEILGQLFVKEYFSVTAKKRYEDMVTNVMEVYAERIKKLDWMSEETKTKALAKLSTITKKVGYPDKWKDYSSMEIDRGSYALNMLRANEWAYNNEVNKLGKPVDRTEWGMTPQTYNAYYNPSNNEIVLPAAIFSIPGMKDELADDAMVYGYAGASTIGHEITHGFDDEGRQFDAEGNLKNWWTKSDEDQFKKKAQVMVEQFNNYVVLDSMHVNGEASLGENLADFAGVVLGYEAFKKTEQFKKGEKINGLTPQQRYFMGYALGWMGHQRDERLANQILTDVHAPANLRVNGPFANIPEFYEAFNIKEGQPMWRADSLRVRIW